MTTAEEFADHLINCTRPVDATIVCDTGVSGDDVITTMVESGEWVLEEGEETFAGKRIRYLRKVR